MFAKMVIYVGNAGNVLLAAEPGIEVQGRHTGLNPATIRKSEEFLETIISFLLVNCISSWWLYRGLYWFLEIMIISSEIAELIGSRQVRRILGAKSSYPKLWAWCVSG